MVVVLPLRVSFSSARTMSHPLPRSGRCVLYSTAPNISTRYANLRNSSADSSTRFNKAIEKPESQG
jgi:hypothetical protein